MVLIWALSLVASQFGGVRRVEWAADCNRVKLEGAGVRVEMIGSMPKTSMRPAIS